MVLLQKETGQRLGEHISQHVVGGYVQERDLAVLNTLPDEVVLCVDVLGVGMMFGIFGQGCGPLVVGVKRDLCVWA